MFNGFPHHRETSVNEITFGTTCISGTNVKKNELRSGGVIGTLVAAGAMIAALPVVFDRMLTRPGVIPFEPLLDHLPPTDMSTMIFGVIYAAVVLTIVLTAIDPVRLLRGLQAYILLVALRMFCMVLVPLEPPLDLVTLQDPFAQLFYPSDVPFEKDLFFSGHTATAFLLFLAVPGRNWRPLFLAVTVFIGIAVLFQHVHWTVDVVAAPFAAWFAWFLSGMTVKWSTRSRAS